MAAARKAGKPMPERSPSVCEEIQRAISARCHTARAEADAAAKEKAEAKAKKAQEPKAAR